MFHAAYDSTWQHPGIAWIAGAPLAAFALLAYASQRRAHDLDPRRRAWLAAFIVLELVVLLDAWLTSPLAPRPLLGDGAAAQTASVVFIVLGDLRYFYLVERQRGPSAAGASASLRALAIAVPVSLLLPIATAVGKLVAPARFQGTSLYLIYELGLLVVALVYALLRAPRPTDAGDGRRRYVGRLLAVELAQYGLWAAADVLILAGVDAGYLLRMVPNAIYYAAFVPLATLATPAGSRT